MSEPESCNEELEKELKDSKNDEDQIKGALPNPKNTINDENLKNNDRENLSFHNEQYTKLLKLYVENFRKISAKKYEDRADIFQIATWLILFVPSVMFIFIGIFLYLIYKGIDVMQLLPVILTALTTVVSSLFVILKIITEYLFDKNEESNLAKIISKIQKYDSKIRDDVKRGSDSKKDDIDNISYM